MSEIIIDPHKPPKTQKEIELEMILNTMRVIGEMRHEYISYEAMKTIEGVSATQIEDICMKQEEVAMRIIRFIIEGKL
jgi:hypothetical protein